MYDWTETKYDEERQIKLNYDWLAWNDKVAETDTAWDLDQQGRHIEMNNLQMGLVLWDDGSSAGLENVLHELNGDPDIQGIDAKTRACMIIDPDVEALPYCDMIMIYQAGNDKLDEADIIFLDDDFNVILTDEALEVAYNYKQSKTFLEILF